MKSRLSRPGRALLLLVQPLGGSLDPRPPVRELLDVSPARGRCMRIARPRTWRSSRGPPLPHGPVGLLGVDQVAELPAGVRLLAGRDGRVQRVGRLAKSEGLARVLLCLRTKVLSGGAGGSARWGVAGNAGERLRRQLNRLTVIKLAVQLVNRRAKLAPSERALVALAIRACDDVTVNLMEEARLDSEGRPLRRSSLQPVEERASNSQVDDGPRPRDVMPLVRPVRADLAGQPRRRGRQARRGR
jgi:hypothetical protein